MLSQIRQRKNKLLLSSSSVHPFHVNESRWRPNDFNILWNLTFLTKPFQVKYSATFAGLQERTSNKLIDLLEDSALEVRSLMFDVIHEIVCSNVIISIDINILTSASRSGSRLLNLSPGSWPVYQPKHDDSPMFSFRLSTQVRVHNSRSFNYSIFLEIQTYRELLF